MLGEWRLTEVSSYLVKYLVKIEIYPHIYVHVSILEYFLTCKYMRGSQYMCESMVCTEEGADKWM